MRIKVRSTLSAVRVSFRFCDAAYIHKNPWPQSKGSIIGIGFLNFVCVL